MTATLPLKTLANACRSLSTLLESGVEVRKSFTLASGKVSDARCREAFAEINTQIAAGHEISAAMRAQGKTFPELMIDMIEMSEGTGSLPEVLTHLADHYENNLRLRREFVGSIMWPMFQLVAAVLIIAGLILIFGMIRDDPGGPNVKQLVFGLSGVGGAIIWLTMTFGSAGLLWAGYQIAIRSFAARRLLDPVWLRLPVLGTCLQSFAIARFSWAYFLTQQSGMPVDRSLTASLKATNNGAFQNATPLVCAGIREGEDLSVVLAESHLFPEDYLHMVGVAETSGTVPEMLHRLSPQFEEQARRSLKALTAAVSWTVWLLVATFIVFFIFRFFSWYVGILNDAVRGAGG
ncbi:MAG: type II secretion system F family protein [Planctomycetes bacterium]|nr:type II secretion system F family protein [Planctomycetota bacterium]